MKRSCSHLVAVVILNLSFPVLGTVHGPTGWAGLVALAERPPRGSVHALFDLNAPVTGPFPSDWFTMADTSHNTGRRVSLPMPDCETHRSDCEDIAVLNALDGFNLQPRLSVPFSGSIDANSVTSDTVFLVSLGSTLLDQGYMPPGTVVGINQVVWDTFTTTLHIESNALLAQHTRFALIFGPEQTRSFPSDKNDVEPRLGFAYDVRGAGRTTIRGGYGIYHGRIPNATIAFAINSTGTAESQSIVQFNPAISPSAAPVFPKTFTGSPGGAVSPNLVVLDPNMQRPSVREGNLVFEHALGSNTVLSAAYLFTVGYGLPTFADVNLPAPTSRIYAIIGGDFDGQTVTVSPFFGGPRPDQRFGVITAIRSLITSKYHAVAVQLNRRLAEGLQFDSSYTLSKATDNGQSSSIFPGSNYPSNPLDLSADHGPSDFDARHKFTATAVWSSASRWSNHRLAHAILKGFTTSMVFFAKSGAPHSAGVGGSPAGGLRAGITGGGGPSLSRVPFFSRNAFRLPKIVNVDLRVSRRFRITHTANLEILGEAFNLLNRTQITELNTRMYVAGGTAAASTLIFDPSFQTVMAAGNNVVRERQLQFGVRLEF